MAFVAIKIGRRQDGPGRAGTWRERICSDTRSRGCGTAGLSSSQPFGPWSVGCFSALLASHVSISDMLVARVLKNSQLTGGESHAISGTGQE